jgi:hypothetical protein
LGGLVKRIERGRRRLTRGGPRRSADQRNEGRDGRNSERVVRRGERFRIRGSRLRYIAAGAPGGDREFCVACSFNSRPFNSGSDFKLEFNSMLPEHFQLSGFSVFQIARASPVTNETVWSNYKCETNQHKTVPSLCPSEGRNVPTQD